MIKVAKFGGSSVADASQFKKVKHIIDSDPTRQFVVVSATGKRFKDDNKVTDLLYLCHAHLKYGVSYETIFTLIEERYQSIKQELKLTVDLDGEFKKIRALMNRDINVDYLVSRGEYLTGLLMAEYLGYDFADAASFIIFNYDGSINFQKTEAALLELLKEKQRLVVPGFYGVLPNGKIKVMSRGGSDITGSIMANVLNADVYENWTDVSGILVADPRIIENPRRIENITYSELRELSYMGANVLHEEAIFPVKEKNIPINIRNTNEPDNPGTMIMEDCSALDAKNTPHFITGISGRKNFTAFTITRAGMSNEVGTIRKVLQVFENYKISVENIPSGIDSFSVVVASEKVNDCIYDLIADIKESVRPDLIKTYENLALIAIVGRGMVFRPGISGKVFGELGKHEINIRTINQGSDEINIVVGVENKDFEKTIRVMYDRFIG